MREGILLASTGQASEEYRRVGYWRMTRHEGEVDKDSDSRDTDSEDDAYFVKKRIQGRTKKIWVVDDSQKRVFTIV